MVIKRPNVGWRKKARCLECANAGGIQQGRAAGPFGKMVRNTYTSCGRPLPPSSQGLKPSNPKLFCYAKGFAVRVTTVSHGHCVGSKPSVLNGSLLYPNALLEGKLSSSSHSSDLIFIRSSRMQPSSSRVTSYPVSLTALRKV